MVYESDKLQEANDELNGKIGLGLFAVFVTIGVYVFFVYGFAYLEASFIPYMIAYAVLCVLLYLSLEGFQVLRILGITGLAALVMMVSVTKINWQKSYYESEEPFMFMAHIDEYPSWEMNLISSFTGKENWVKFARECGDPARLGFSFREECRSYAGIQQRYNINMNVEVEEYLARMRHTASLIQKRGSLTGPQYKNCIYKGECAEIPLLEKEVKPEDINPEDQQFLYITQAYWDLVEAKPLTPEVCSFMTLCQVLRTTGAIRFE